MGYDTGRTVSGVERLEERSNTHTTARVLIARAAYDQHVPRLQQQHCLVGLTRDSSTSARLYSPHSNLAEADSLRLVMLRRVVRGSRLYRVHHTWHALRLALRSNVGMRVCGLGGSGVLREVHFSLRRSGERFRHWVDEPKFGPAALDAGSKGLAGQQSGASAAVDEEEAHPEGEEDTDDDAWG